MMRPLSVLGYVSFAPDMPGFGGSFDPSSDPPSISWYADLYHALFCTLPDFKNGCHIVGHHSGGVIGSELAAKYPGFVRSLTIIGPAIMSADDRLEMSKTFLTPFNKPVPSGEHLAKTWDYLRWEGIPEESDDLMQREALDHIRAWKGRSQIYACVWDYDSEASLKMIQVKGGKACAILGLCARDDVLWPYFDNFKELGNRVTAMEIKGGNFGPDLDTDNIMRIFVDFISQT